jgi:hypothetical protein
MDMLAASEVTLENVLNIPDDFFPKPCAESAT